MKLSEEDKRKAVEFSGLVKKAIAKVYPDLDPDRHYVPADILMILAYDHLSQVATGYNARLHMAAVVERVNGKIE